MEYGIIIGRFQPLHLGHQTIIDEIINDGLEPIIFIGSSNVINERNPLSYKQRAFLIHSVYNDKVITLPLPDRVDHEVWANGLISTLKNIKINKEDCKLYYYEKRGDFWIAPWFINYFKIHRPISKMPNISATEIRKDLEANRLFLDFNVYKKYKEIMKIIE